MRVYWTLGRYDGVAIIEAPSEKAAMKAILSFQNLINTETMVAVPETKQQNSFKSKLNSLSFLWTLKEIYEKANLKNYGTTLELITFDVFLHNADIFLLCLNRIYNHNKCS